jgi:hypothetical protein
MVTQMTDPTATLVGVKYSTAIAGFFGSVVALTFAKELTLLRLILAIITGSLTAHYSTSPLAYYLKVPIEFNDSLAFGVGLLAMSLIPLIFSILEELKKRAGDAVQKFLG